MKHIQQFGSLTSYAAMESYLQKCRLQSRENLLKRLYHYDKSPKKSQTFSTMQSSGLLTSNKKNKFQQKSLDVSNLQNAISQTFQDLMEWADFDINNSIVKQVARIFSINLDYLYRKSPQQKKMYVLQKIHEQVKKNLSDGHSGFQTSTLALQSFQQENKQSNPQQNNQAFQWLGVNTSYTNLKPIFQQILMERVKLFDNQLSQLTSLTNNNTFTSLDQIVTTARTIDFPQQKQRKLKPSHRSLTNIMRRKQLKKQLQSPSKGFCNIKIRDESTFSLDKWTKKQQKQFQQKRQEYKKRQAKIQNTPVLFQFVKKYTKTVKARQNIYKKWQTRQKSQITPDELKYLCATSLFLNQTLNSSEKSRYKRNIETAGKRLISRLQFNIAEHIIETYKIFMKKVFDLRAAYYEQLTSKRKLQYSKTKKNQEINSKMRIRIAQLQKSIKMYRTIVNSQKMKLILNPKICRWVVLFCKKLKEKAKIKSKSLQRKRNYNFVKSLESKKVEPFIIGLKKSAPSTKILKRQNHDNFRSQTKKYVQGQKFFYEPKFQQAISKFNKLKLTKSSSTSAYSFKKQLTGGPLTNKMKVHVDLSKKSVRLDSKKCIQHIIKIQSIWRQHYYRKIYLKIRDAKRKQNQQDFQRRFDRLWRIYPLGKKVNFNVIINRLKRVSMRIKNIAKPYVRVYRKPINLFTSFSKHNFSLSQLKIKYAKMSKRRLSEFVNLVEQNFYSTIVQNAYVVTQKQINSSICKQGATVLWWAVSNSNYQLVKKLLEGGGDPNAKNIQNNYCLHQAMRKGDIEIIFLLLDYGGDLNVKNNKKQTPLYYCTNKMLKLLGLEQGTSIISQSDHNNSTNAFKYYDNNKLFFKPPTEQIYNEHYY